MILEIKKFPDKALRQKAKPLGTVMDEDRRLIRDMFDTMYFAKGVGLAAPQVGVLKRIIVCNPTGEKNDELAVINPVILYRKGKKVRECEGCLSIPTITAEVSRHTIIGASGKDPNGEAIKLEAIDMLARIIDHETDHLNGVLFIDRMGLIKRKLLLAQYKKKMGISCVGRWY